jgi:hypothetical protein
MTATQKITGYKLNVLEYLSLIHLTLDDPSVNHRCNNNRNRTTIYPVILIKRSVHIFPSTHLTSNGTTQLHHLLRCQLLSREWIAVGYTSIAVASTCHLIHVLLRRQQPCKLLMLLLLLLLQLRIDVLMYRRSHSDVATAVSVVCSSITRSIRSV